MGHDVALAAIALCDFLAFLGVCWIVPNLVRESKGLGIWPWKRRS